MKVECSTTEALLKNVLSHSLRGFRMYTTVANQISVLELSPWLQPHMV